MRVLLVDDNEELREALRRVLERSGYEVQLAADGAEALALQGSRPADVLVTDLFMPERDGFETIESFRARYPAVHIIAMSGDAHIRIQTDYLKVAREIGAQHVLRKPFNPDELLHALQRARLRNGAA